jgi:hypothetical protein
MFWSHEDVNCTQVTYIELLVFVLIQASGQWFWALFDLLERYQTMPYVLPVLVIVGVLAPIDYR